MALSDQIAPHNSFRAPNPQAMAVGSIPQGKLPWPVTLYFLMILLPVEFNLGSLFMTGVRLILILLAIPMAIKLFTKKAGPYLWTDLFFALFSIWNIISLFHNNPDQAISFGGSVGVEFLGGYLLGRLYIRTAADLLAMCKMLFLVVTITIPFAIYESQTGVALIPTLIEKLPVVFSLDDFYNELAGRRLGLERSQVIFAHPIHYGLFCSTAIALAFVGFKDIYSTRFRIFVTFLMLLGVFLSVSSGALLPVILQFGLIIWARIFDSVRARWYYLLALTAFCYVVVSMLSNRTPIQVFLSYATFSPHNAYWRMLIFEWGMKNVWSNPFWGIGLNEWVRPWFMHSGSMDNFFLLIAVRYGIPGFLMTTIGLALLVWKVMWRDFDSDRILWQLRRAWMITMVGLILTLCTVDVWATAYSYVAFLIGTGSWFITVKPSTAAAADGPEDAPPSQRAELYRRAAPSKGQASGPHYTRFPTK